MALFAQLTVHAKAQMRAVPFTGEQWDLSDATVSEHLGRQALSGNAWLKDTKFENGVIEVDMAIERKRAYPAIIFRRQSEGNFEHVYFRPHRASLYDDAIQYAPSTNGVSSWQLYRGPGFTAPADLPENEWVHIRIEVKGTQARVFVGDSPEAALMIDKLIRGAEAGAIGLQSEQDGSVFFSAFSVEQTDKLNFKPSAPATPVPGLMADWELSPVTNVFDLAPERYLDGKDEASIDWLPAQCDARGMVDINRFRKPTDYGKSKIWARTVINSEQKEMRPFAFGYSDAVSIYLNGQILFHGESAYRQRDPSFLGIIGWNDTVYLPLEKGENTLVLCLHDEFGGWGFMARDVNAVYMDDSLSELWTIGGLESGPESAAYDPDRNIVYVSGFNDGSIAKIGLEGKIIASNWLSGLATPTGLKYHKGKLYAVERSGVMEIDPETATISARHLVKGASFINDLSFDKADNIYLSDTFGNRIYKLSGEKAEVLIEGEALGNPNGILADNDRILIGVSAEGRLKAFDLNTAELTTFLSMGDVANMDGLTSDGKGGYLFSDYYGRICHADAQGKFTVLRDSRGAHGYAADFEYIPSKGMLIVPAFLGNEIKAYSLHLKGE